MRAIRVAIADDEPLVRRALGELIEGEPALELVGEAEDADSVIELVEENVVDVALVDVKMPRGGGPRAAREIKKVSPRTRIIALSAYSDRDTVVEMVRAGAVGYVVKGSPGSEIVDTIVSCARGGSRISAEVTGEVLAELSHHLRREEQESQSRRLELQRIRDLLDRGALTTVFQPIVRLDTRELVGLEALSRFPDDLPDPAAWFRSAETVGLRTELEICAARAALAHLPSIDRATYVAVNLSPKTLEVWRSATVDTAGWGRIVLEITEHARIDDYDRLKESLDAARADGARVAVDDVGAGFASLKHILQLTPDFIKLDASLTRDVHTDRSRRALATGLISFAAELGATIVAEGIETSQELDALRELGVRFGQGYYIARPAPLSLLMQEGEAAARAGDDPPTA